MQWHKHLAAASALLAINLPALASTSTTEIYGQLNVSTDFLDTDSRGESLNISSNNSRIGFRGRHIVEPQLTLLWQAETTLRVDSQGGDLIDRDTFLGATGDWGQVRVGKFDTPLKGLRNRVDFFGNQVGDARNVVRNRVDNPDGDGQIGWDERFRNGIAYRTPAWQGVTAEVHYATRLDNNGTTTSDTNAWSGAISWQGARAWLAVAHERQVYVNTGAPDFKRSASRVAGYYDIGDLRVTGFYQYAEDPDDSAYGAGARYRLSEKLALKTQYYRLDADADDSNAELYAVGLDYQVARNLQTYANYAVVRNQDLAALRPYTQGRTTGGGAELAVDDGSSPSGISLGVSYRF